jgi:hypothetical protein
MPRTRRPKPDPTPTPEPQTVALNGPSGDVLTLAEAAAYLRLPEKDVIAAASTQGLPGRLVAGEWRFLRSALQQWLSASQPTAEMRKAAQMAVAGAWKDDPTVDQLREEIEKYRRQLDAEVGR